MHGSSLTLNKKKRNVQNTVPRKAGLRERKLCGSLPVRLAQYPKFSRRYFSVSPLFHYHSRSKLHSTKYPAEFQID